MLDSGHSLKTRNMPLGLKFKKYFTFRGLEKVGILLHKCQQMLFIVHFKPDSIKGHDIT